MKFAKWVLLTGMSAVSAAAVANGQYPAADFQPKVVYQDESAKAAASSVPVAAQSAQPCKEAAVPAATTAASASKPVQEDVDARYPAANFQPKVVYSGN
jgi:hypothetical protein